MKKSRIRLNLEECAAEEMLRFCGKEEKPRLYIRHLAAKARLSRAAASFWRGREAEIALFWAAEAFRFEQMVVAAKTMREYMEAQK